MLEANLQTVKEQIAKAAQKSGRQPTDVTLVAVSKFVLPTVVREALELGQHVFGENYVQEGCSKKEEFGDSIEIHLIGNLQRNKAKKAVGIFELIHTIDRIEVAEEIAKIAERQELVQRGLIQVNISKEKSKSGVMGEKLPSLLEQALRLSSLKIEGLMCIGSWDQGDDVRVKEFETLRNLRDESEKSFGVALPELSMGMSRDFELAIEHGATLVRVGSALFGERE